MQGASISSKWAHFSSGAMASGIRKLGLAHRPDELPKRQAVAAVGQAGLILEYEKAFNRYHQKVAQILLTSDDLSHRKRYLNSRVPIVKVEVRMEFSSTPRRELIPPSLNNSFSNK